jgi:hypothetical protein
MAYIGNQVSSVLFTVNTFSGDGSGTSFGPMDRAPAGPASVAVYISGVYKTPSIDYTVSGDYINFTTAPALGTNNITVHHLGNGVMATQTPSDGTVNSSKLSSNVSITNFTANTTMKLPVFASNGARDTAITAPQAGMVAFITTGTQFQGHTGSGWIVLSN